VGFTVPRPLPAARCALAAPFRPYPTEAGRYALEKALRPVPSPRLHAFRPRRIRRSVDAQVFPYVPGEVPGLRFASVGQPFRDGDGERRVCRAFLLCGEGPMPKHCPVLAGGEPFNQHHQLEGGVKEDDQPVSEALHAVPPKADQTVPHLPRKLQIVPSTGWEKPPQRWYSLDVSSRLTPNYLPPKVLLLPRYMLMK
jgi:hypothetical protein